MQVMLCEMLFGRRHNGVTVVGAIMCETGLIVHVEVERGQVVGVCGRVGQSQC